MAVIAQRDGVRVVAFQKCGHTSIINMFLTPADVPLVRGGAIPDDAYRGTVEKARSWPEPRLTIAFMRNPLMRAFSAYDHFIIRTQRASIMALGFTPDMSFTQFITHLGEIDLTADEHLKPQWLSFIEACASLDVYGGQLEQLDTTWPLIVDQYGLDCTKEIPHYNRAERDYMWDTEDRLPRSVLAAFKVLYATDYACWNAAHFEAGTSFSSVYH